MNKIKIFLKSTFIILIFLSSYITKAQNNNVGIGTTTPDISALLELSSLEKGLLIPRMPTNFRTNMPNLSTNSNGLLVYDTDYKQFFYYDFPSDTWISINGSKDTTITGNYTAKMSDYTILVDASAGNVTVTLPAAGNCISKIFIIKAIDISNSITVDPLGVQTIDGVLNYPFSNQYESITIQSDGNEWWIIGGFNN